MLDDRRMHGDVRTQQRHVLAALARGIIISGGTPAIHAAGLWSGAGAYSAAIRVGASAARSGADGGQTLVGAVSFGKSGRWRKTSFDLCCATTSWAVQPRPDQSRAGIRVNCSTASAPSTSHLVARAAGKPSCWPMGTQAQSGVGFAPLP